jgi:hypothetical protein
MIIPASAAAATTAATQSKISRSGVVMTIDDGRELAALLFG